ncbi:glycine betaine/L-proline ABC transporter ATP-binding protein [Kiloniella sp. EL199]|uniref:quaternary amine ABC transporter ATP-binding protein n=1 Tax=Kiloniella sp. EL199 TaxID=2107581 RepID=UPI0020B16413|nr:betaine/proline/choline family ABC transporter ATP-binding protein [Kiloniella sp. EL199]
MPQSNAIEISGVWKIFGAREKEALADVEANNISKKQVLEKYNCVVGVANATMDIRPGEIFCIMGLSGSGKSTLVRHINRLLEPTAGSINVNGQNIMAMDSDTLRQYRNEHIAMVFQNFALMPHRSVLDNVALPLEIRGVNKNQRMETAMKAIDMVDLTPWGNKFAHELSGGMQQRVGLARALAADPEILLMDEPFSALDPLIRRQLQDEFMKLAAQMNKTTVFITHDLDEAVRIGDRIAIMRDGMVIQIGTPEDIVMNPVDDYVSDFVAGISRLKVVRAHAVMQSLSDYEGKNGSLSENAQEFSEGADLGVLIEAAIETEKPAAIVDQAGKRIGVVTRADLLRTVIEGTETS